MNEIFQLPEILTMVSYLVLFCLAVWVVAHAIHIFSEGRKVKIPRIKKICAKLDRFTGKLLEKVEEIKRLRAEERKIARRKSGGAQKLLDEVRSCIAKERGWRDEIMLRGPGNDIYSWLKRERVDSRIIGCLDSRGSAQLGSSREGTSYRLALGIPAAIATPAGAAPTMSGTMTFLRDYSTSIEEGGGVLPLSGLNDALLTTWAGCFLTIVSVVLLAYSLNRSGTGMELEEAKALIAASLSDWNGAVSKARRNKGST